MKEHNVRKAMKYIEQRQFLDKGNEQLKEALNGSETRVVVMWDNTSLNLPCNFEFRGTDMVRALMSAIAAEMKAIDENLKNLGVEK